MSNANEEKDASVLTPLLCCIQCGSPACELDYSSVTEFYGISSQAADITCSGNKSPYCPVEVCITFDSDGAHDSKRLEKVLTAAWNALNET